MTEAREKVRVPRFFLFPKAPRRRRVCALAYGAAITLWTLPTWGTYAGEYCGTYIGGWEIQSSAYAAGDAPWQQRNDGAPSGGWSDALPAAQVRSVSLNVTTQKFDPAWAATQRAIAANDGTLLDLEQSAEHGDRKKLKATIRVPAQKLDPLLAAIRETGWVQKETHAVQDFSTEAQRLSIRLRNAQVAEKRLLGLLATRPGKVNEVLEAEREAVRLRNDIEQLETQRRTLDFRLHRAAIYLWLEEEYLAPVESAPPTKSTRLRNAAVEGYSILADSALGFLETVISVGPFFLFWALILYFPLKWIWKRWKAWRAAHPCLEQSF